MKMLKPIVIQTSVFSSFFLTQKTHVAHRLGKHYHMCFYHKLGHDTCAIGRIPCVFTKYTSTIDKPWNPSVPQH